MIYYTYTYIDILLMRMCQEKYCWRDNSDGGLLW